MMSCQILLNTTVKKLTAHPFKYGRYQFLKFYRPYWKTLYERKDFSTPSSYDIDLNEYRIVYITDNSSNLVCGQRKFLIIPTRCT